MHAPRPGACGEIDVVTSMRRMHRPFIQIGAVGQLSQNPGAALFGKDLWCAALVGNEEQPSHLIVICRDVEERVVMDGSVTRDLAHRQTGARIARERRFTLECRSFAHVVLLTDRITEAAEHGNSAALSL